MENIVILILLIIFGVLLVAGVIAFVVHKKRKSNKTSHKDSDEIKNQLLKLQEENEKLKELEGKIGYSFWERTDDTHTVIRLATSWSTRPEDIEALKELL